MRRSKEDAELTRTTILDAAERLFVERGYAATPLEAIAQAAGATRGALYWHFRDKAALLSALHERSFLPQEQILTAVAEREGGNPLAALLDATLAALISFEADESRQRTFRIMSDLSSGAKGCAHAAKVESDMRAVTERIMTRARDARWLHPAFSPAEAAVFVTATIVGLLTEWLKSGKSFPLAARGDRLLRCHVAMLQFGPIECPLEYSGQPADATDTDTNARS